MWIIKVKYSHGITKTSNYLLLIFFIIFLSVVGVGIVGVTYLCRSKKMGGQPRHIPKQTLKVGGSHTGNLESFSQYFARQIGFEDEKECPNLGKLAIDYLKKTKKCEENIYTYFRSNHHPDVESICIKLIEELDKCILGYFGFHWSHTNDTITKVLSHVDHNPTMDSTMESNKKLKKIILEVTRKTRFERITKELKVKRVFSTLVEEMKVIGKATYDDNLQKEKRSPVLMLMGGGMGAGKSTVLKEILKEQFWSETKPVVIEADAFKETDVIYQALNSKGYYDDMLETAELVHKSSTNAASSLLVTALNEGRDVIMDGTLSWIPFVEQTITMARLVHKHRFRMGVGYQRDDDGLVTENYWEQVNDNDIDDPISPRKEPYRIELVGIVCDAYLAVVRGIRRAIMIGRAVRVKSQLKSHKMFASAFPRYCHSVDNARLYCTKYNNSPKLIAWKDGASNLLVDSEEIDILNKVCSLNEDADSIYGLYPHESYTKYGLINMVLSPSRVVMQKELKVVIEEFEATTLTSSSS
ncbi:hypothetical protein ZOSMA_121G00070 [Zostera marina]|uniref:Zeta toxin domain-containing protein n=1 Tax=Zostera marina TaxID=29655 RepID=A0A0K9Q0Z6_ZOSMR|nr:hypothetical protein ZOSMA_121G00070 [Zostera marina]